MATDSGTIENGIVEIDPKKMAEDFKAQANQFFKLETRGREVIER